MSKEDSNGPRSIGIIMDGNRRWAKENGLLAIEGHRAGAEKLKEVLRWARDQKIEETIVYAFSSENWNRSEIEVQGLMKLVDFTLDNWIDELIDEDGRLRIIGQLDRLPEKVQEKIKKVTERTKDGENGTLVVALSYGGRAEILDAVNKLLIQGREVVTEKELRDSMWSAGVLDPDLIIRTGGEQRLSNFLPWQSVYSELIFTKTLWPGLTQEEFNEHIESFRARKRNFGK